MALAIHPERFDILRTLGEGGMGTVYEAFDRIRGERVALKTIRGSDADSIYRLKREFRALADHEHPNLVRLFDLFVTDTDSFFTMELVRGIDFVAACASAPGIEDDADTVDLVDHRTFDEGALRTAIADVAYGIEALHRRGLLHRDLKPSNVIVRSDGRAVILDFGLVADAHASAQLSVAGSVVGTIIYMAPEQARGEPELTYAIDWYALGAMIYEVLTSRPPFAGPALKILGDKQLVVPPDPSAAIPNLPDDLVSLAMDLLALDPKARPTYSEIVSRLGISRSVRPTSSSDFTTRPLFGRAAELRLIEEAYDACRDGRPSAVLVTGRSGIGKSALLAHFAHFVEKRDGAVILAGRCHEWETVAFKGLDGVVDSLSRLLGRLGADDVAHVLPPDLGDLGTVFPVLRRHKRIASAHARRALAYRPPQQIRQSAFACLREMLRRLAETRALVIVIDDVHWADLDTSIALRSLLLGEHPPGLFLMLGARPFERDDAPVVRALSGAAADGEPVRIRPIELHAIPANEMRAMVARDLGANADDTLVDTIARESRGLPFAASELVRWTRDGANNDEVTGASVDELVLRRAEVLSDVARRVLDRVALAGEPVSADLVLTATIGRDDDRSAIDELRAGQWIRGVRTAASTLVDTTHDRIREALLAAMSDETRRAIHRSLATAMEASESPPHDRLARHFAAAGDTEPARHHAILAARNASDALAFRRASELYTIAVDSSVGAERVELLPVVADALERSGENAAAAAMWFEAATGTADAHLARAYRIRAAESLLHAGQVDRGLEVLGDAARELGVRISSSTARAFWEAAKARLRLSFRGMNYRLRSRSEIAPSDLARLRAIGAIANAVGSIDPVASAALSTRYLFDALRIGDAGELAAALAGETFVRAASGDFEEAERLVGLLTQVAERDPNPRVLGWLESARAALGFGDGRGGAVAVHAERALAAFESDPDTQPWERSQAYFSLAASGLMSGDFEQCQRASRYAAERVELTGDAAELRLRTSLLLVFEIVRGNLDRADALADERVWTDVTSRDVCFRLFQSNFRGWIDLYTGRSTNVTESAWAVWKRIERNGFGRTSSVRYDCLRLVTAAATAEGHPHVCDDALRAFGRPSTDLERFFQARLKATHAIAHGRRDDAIRYLESCWPQAESWGSMAWSAMDRWALMRLHDPERAAVHRSALETFLRSGLVMDPDRFYWTFYPVGPRPERIGSPRLIPASVGRSEPMRPRAM